MAGRKRQALAADLSQAATRFERWRQKRVKGERIPEQLWTVATELAGHHGVSRTAGVLKLDYYTLKERRERAPGPWSGPLRIRTRGSSEQLLPSGWLSSSFSAESLGVSAIATFFLAIDADRLGV